MAIGEDVEVTEFSKKIPLARDSTLDEPRSWWDKQLMEQAQRQQAQLSSWPKSPPNPDTSFKIRDMGPSVAFSQGSQPYRQLGVGWGQPRFGPSTSDVVKAVDQFSMQPVDRVKMMMDTVNDAFRRISGSNSDGRHATGLSSEFVNLRKLPNFSKGEWERVPSIHSSKAYEHIIPGSSGMVLKVYLDDDDHGGLNTATITSPTWSAEHMIGTLEYGASRSVNEEHAKRYIRGILDSDRNR